MMSESGREEVTRRNGERRRTVAYNAPDQSKIWSDNRLARQSSRSHGNNISPRLICGLMGTRALRKGSPVLRSRLDSVYSVYRARSLLSSEPFTPVYLPGTSPLPNLINIFPNIYENRVSPVRRTLAGIKSINRREERAAAVDARMEAACRTGTDLCSRKRWARTRAASL